MRKHAFICCSIDSYFARESPASAAWAGLEISSHTGSQYRRNRRNGGESLLTSQSVRVVAMKKRCPSSDRNSGKLLGANSDGRNRSKKYFRNRSPQNVVMKWNGRCRWPRITVFIERDVPIRRATWRAELVIQRRSAPPRFPQQWAASGARPPSGRSSYSAGRCGCSTHIAASGE
jgi:hypothetical protein